jgi:hypothetical protein
MFNIEETEERFAAAHAAGIRLVRLSATKWRGVGRDFLIGDADAFAGLVPEDVVRLREALDAADRQGLKVVLTTMSLPGARWREQNGDKPDLRLWREQRYREMAQRFWTELARALQGHPALIGYEPLNEPCPEVLDGLHDWWKVDYRAWYPPRRGSLQDVNRFNREMLAAIRSVDREMPVIVSGGLYSYPTALPMLEPLPDPNVIYSFHMYEPYEFIRHTNRGRFVYPGDVPVDPEDPSTRRRWDRAALEQFLTPVGAFQSRHRIPAKRIWAAEFGCFRRNDGCEAYMGDLTSIFSARGWHWTYWAFREDDWHGWDYELGTAPMQQPYWDALEKGERPPLPRRDNPLFEVIQKAFRVE